MAHASPLLMAAGGARDRAGDAASEACFLAARRAATPMATLGSRRSRTAWPVATAASTSPWENLGAGERRGG